MAISINVPTDTKIGVAVSGGFDSAVLWYEVYKICLERGQECVPITAPQTQWSETLANEVLAYVAGELGGDITETTVVGDSFYDEFTEDDASVVGRAFGTINDNIATYGDNFFTGQAVEHDPTGDLEAYRIHTFGTANLCSLIEANYPAVNWHFPFQTKNKVDILTHMSEANMEICTELLTITSSCYKPTIGAETIERCNDCPSCTERAWGLEMLGITDPGSR